MNIYKPMEWLVEKDDNSCGCFSWGIMFAFMAFVFLIWLIVDILINRSPIAPVTGCIVGTIFSIEMFYLSGWGRYEERKRKEGHKA